MSGSSQAGGAYTNSRMKRIPPTTRPASSDQNAPWNQEETVHGYKTAFIIEGNNSKINDIIPEKEY